MHLQCHPQALRPTKRHPACRTFYPAIAADWGMPCHPAALWAMLKLRGAVLVHVGQYEAGYLDSLPTALAWARRWNKSGDTREARVYA